MVEVGERWLVRRSVMGQLLEVEVLALSPSRQRVKLSDLGWQTYSDIGFVEMLAPSALTQKGDGQ